MIMTKFSDKPKISIGLPVFNGEKFLPQRLDSILSQTFTDFELIISDNVSTDSTSEICNEFSKNDSRIRYVKQKKNMGATWNFNFVLKEAHYDYFIWAGVDDIWKPKFLEKNITPLLSNKNFVGSISKIEFYGLNTDTKSNKINSLFRNFLRSIRYSLKPGFILPLTDSYEEKIKLFLKKSRMHMIYGIFVTDILRKSFVRESFVGNDTALILNILKYGDFHVVDEILINFYDAGAAKKGMLNHAQQFNSSLIDVIFPYRPLTKWCLKNFGLKLFLKNFDYFIQLNLWGSFSLFVDIIKLISLKILHLK